MAHKVSVSMVVKALVDLKEPATQVEIVDYLAYFYPMISEANMLPALVKAALREAIAEDRVQIDRCHFYIVKPDAKNEGSKC